MNIDEMIQALEAERQIHGGEIECVIELPTANGIETVRVDELSTEIRQVAYEKANRRNKFVRTEKCTMFLC